MTGAVAVALTLTAVAVWSFAFGGGGNSPLAGATGLNEARATDLLRTVVSSARGAYASEQSYTSLNAASLSARTHNVPVVGPSTVARFGTVSMQVLDSAVVTIATPAAGHRCVFARDNAARDTTVFITVSTSDCRASAAPATGWSRR